MKRILTLRLLTLIAFIACAGAAVAQTPAMPGGGGNWGNRGGGTNFNIGRFYGKVVDEKTSKGIEYATVQLFQNKWDSATKAMKMTLVTGDLTRPNGDFSLEKLPVMAKFLLKISAIGYDTYEQNIAFELKMGERGEGGMSQALNAVDKDLGNIKLKPNVQQLKEVVVDGSEPDYKLEIDKKVYNVEKNIVNAGGTAEDVLKNVPSVNVDLDGNVTVRNASPQIFVDGRPTTLTIDQIPADAIEKIEVITNPSAKYDASGGGAGIINIVLKKSKRLGYNGSVRAGADMRGRFNLGGDLNLREEKINVFANANINQRKSLSQGNTDRFNLIGNPKTNIFQESNSSSIGYFGFLRGGIDYFMDNRNTLTISQSGSRGMFDPKDGLSIRTDSLYDAYTGTGSSFRNSNNHREFQNLGTSLLFKHLFPKEGKELTADVNYNRSKNSSSGEFETQYYDSYGQGIGVVQKQQQKGRGSSEFLTVQTDYVNPIKDKIKIEGGLRGSVRNYSSINENFIFNYTTGEFEKLYRLTSNYRFTDQVYAGYITFTNQIKKFGYQAGLRAESSDYEGELIDSSMKFRNSYPVSLFPSVFLTYKKSEKGQWQLNYSRRINRPGFFQLIPFTDYSDSLNLSRGNPGLKPEFTNSLELSVDRKLGQGSNVIASVYFKNSTNLISNYQLFEYNTVLNKNVIISTYQNASSSYAYGMELTSRNSIKKKVDITANVNLYNSVIDAQNLDSALTNEQLSWTGKLSINWKLPKNISAQVSGDYKSRTVMPGGGGGGGGRWSGGGHFWSGSMSTVQGYIEPTYSVDMAVRYEFMKNKAASLNVSVSDIFRTRRHITHSESPFFVQDSERIRDSRFLRVNFSYRFGKFDASLFKRKNNKMNSDGMDMQMQ